MKAVLDRDWDGAVRYFSDDAVRLPLNAPAERGRVAIRQHFDAVDRVAEWKVHSLEVDGAGRLAYARMFLSITAYLRGKPEPFSYTGKQLFVLRRQADGAWRIVTDMWNSDGL